MGIEFEVFVPDVEEVATGGTPEDLVLANARAKARAGSGAAGPGELVLGVDTEVVLDGRLLGKPADAPGARERLEALSGRAHEVLSGVVVLGPGPGAERSGVERTTVRFAALGEGLIDAYVASGEWRDRAGGYAIQGLGSALVETVDGDVSNVIGMPVRLFAQLVPEISEKP